ncbi:MAG TPA: PIN domain-containing protein [Thermomicrobiales bacterium]|nr:PIN domain-containing protein [Thermomicrobiales bacterium]
MSSAWPAAWTSRAPGTRCGRSRARSARPRSRGARSGRDRALRRHRRHHPAGHRRRRAKQAAARTFFRAVERGETTVAAPYTVIADAVFVLASPRIYGLPRARVAAALTTLVQLPRFPVENKRTVLRALSLYGGASLDFGDAMLVAAMEQAGARDLYSFDHDFDRFAQLDRREP